MRFGSFDELGGASTRTGEAVRCDEGGFCEKANGHD
jgi:hypothetical protein